MGIQNPTVIRKKNNLIALNTYLLTLRTSIIYEVSKYLKRQSELPIVFRLCDFFDRRLICVSMKERKQLQNHPRLQNCFSELVKKLSFLEPRSPKSLPSKTDRRFNPVQTRKPNYSTSALITSHLPRECHALDGNRWRALTNTVMNLWVP